ncbi:flagellar hook-length control protein FliK [Guyparkeria hydrothermalis]|uniref:flagellar hook-length control protein FliK n=1 Tax=Guyparkeria hydrothermalis TaxID=923 RepID=UPI002020D0F2|nr:flagellar hook-length control protein FliK [Guyparkeria hydrothermalis]MCL7750482.1 flagellar hook-length control protein FliK [Guyparkeria hydrothermalis]
MKILKVEQPGQTTPAGQVLRLQTGQRLAAISLSDARPGERATLSVAGGQLQVTTQHPLKAGQAIDLEVTRLGEQVHLRPLGPPPDPRQLDQAQLTRNLLQALARVGTAGASNTPGAAAPATPTSVAASLAQAQTAPTPFTQAQITPAQTNPLPSPQASPAAGAARGTPGNAAVPAPPASPSPSQATGTAGGATASIPAAILQATRPGGGAAATESMLRTALSQGVTSGTATTGPGAATQATAALATPAVSSPSAQTVPPGLNGLLPLLSALREPRLIQGLVAGWLATADNPARPPNPLAGVGGPMPAPAGQGLTETPLGSLLQQAARSLRAQPDLAPRDPAARQATLEFMQRIGDQVERSQLATALSQGAAGAAAGTQTGPNQPTWLLEIPLQLANEAHALRLGIREEDESGEARSGGGRWRIDLAMEWPRLGPLHAALVMQGERIDVDLFADQPETVTLLETTRPTLAQALSDSGLTPGRLGTYPGPPPASARARLEPDTNGAAGTSAPDGFLSEQA